MESKEFNLIYEPWIKVVDMENQPKEVSLRELFENAHNYKKLSGETVTQDAAIFRILLAILLTIFYRYDADGQDDNILEYEKVEECILERWKEYWDKGKFDPYAFSLYLEKFRERFYLFHPETPFWQVAAMADEKKWEEKYKNKPTQYDVVCLLGNIKGSNNPATKYHFSMTDGEYMKRLPYAEVARWLVYQNAYSVNVKTKVGGNSISVGVGRLGQLGLIKINEGNLFRELMINMCPLKMSSEAWDEPNPMWENPVCEAPGRKIIAPNNLPELYTIQSRKMFLQRDENGNVIKYKSTGGDYYSTENDDTEQMSKIVKIIDGGNEFKKPKQHRMNVQAWREIPALLMDDSSCEISNKKNIIIERPCESGLISWMKILKETWKNDFKKIITISMIGLEYGDKMCYTNGNIISDSVSMTADLLTEIGKVWIKRIQVQIEKCQKAASVVRMINSRLENQYYFKIDIAFRAWLKSIAGEDNFDAKQQEWEEDAYFIAKGVIEGYASNIEPIEAINLANELNKAYGILKKIYTTIEERREDE